MLVPGGTISNAKRGCGYLKEGGFYAHSEVGTSGTLSAWTAAYGSGVVNMTPELDSQGRSLSAQLTVEQVSRQMGFINLPGTLSEGRKIEGMDYENDLTAYPSLQQCPLIALIDHVGSEYYTAWSFMRETQRQGVNRRIPERVARNLSLYLPIPIAFTHSQMLLVRDRVTAEALGQWSSEIIDQAQFSIGLYPRLDMDSEEAYYPSPYHENWGLLADSYDNLDHWQTHNLAALHIASGERGKQSPLQLLPQSISKRGWQVEQLFGISWITSFVYVMKPDEQVEDLGRLIESGVVPVRADQSAE